MPHGAVLVAREIDGALDLVLWHVAGNRVFELHARDAVRILGRPLGDENDLQALQIVASLAQDMDDIHGHAAGKSEPESLDWRRPRNRRAVEGHGRAAGTPAE